MIGGNGAGKTNFLSSFTLLHYVFKNEHALYAAKSGMSSLFYNGLKVTSNITMEFHYDTFLFSLELVPTDSNSVILKPSNSLTRVLGHTSIFYDWHYFHIYHFHDTSRYSKIKQEHNISNCNILQWDASNLAAFLYRLRENYPSAYTRIIETIQLAAPFFNDFMLEPNEHNNEHIVLRWYQKGCNDIFNASQLSDGTLRFICLTTLLLQPEELQPTTIIIDEPELGLHPFAIVLLAEMVQKAALKKQIILSTQSTELLNQFEPEDVIVVNRGGDGSIFKRLNPDELTVWLEDDYSLSELWNKNILGGRFSK